MKGKSGVGLPTFERVLTSMMQSGNFVPAPHFVESRNCLDIRACNKLWYAMILPKEVEVIDTCQIFFNGDGIEMHDGKPVYCPQNWARGGPRNADYWKQARSSRYNVGDGIDSPSNTAMDYNSSAEERFDNGEFNYQEGFEPQYDQLQAQYDDYLEELEKAEN